MILILTSLNNPLSPGPSIHLVLQEYCSSSLAVIDDTVMPYPDQVGRLFDEFRPKIVLNCHEYPDIDAAENERETAYAINGLFLKSLSARCLERDIQLIQLSTSYVFSGSGAAPYTEEDEPDPVSVYGDSKLLGERLVLESGCRHVILRVPDLFGEGMPLVNSRLAMKHENGILQVIRGQVAAPVYSGDLALAVSELVSRDCHGIYHFSQDGAAPTGDVISRVLELCGRYGVTDEKYSVMETEKEDFLAPGERPMYNVLDAEKLKGAAGISARGWDRALEDYISRKGSSIILT
ncbi:MAG TPA: NAD(P)-dependent oxidoreductase [Spirochaetota bacterium]|nr:NAD(P)-dependent oxidoreductase [Spirochaetota bacterium]